MNVPINLLQGLIAIAESSSLAVAADSLHITQPALSMQLKKLDDFFDIPIFEFQGKRKVLTPYGRSCYLEAKRLVNEFALSFERLNRQFMEPSKLSLRVGGRRELLSKAQKSILFEGKVIFDSMSSQDSIRALENREIDIAISRIKPNSSEIIAKKFMTNCPWLVTHKKWTKGKTNADLSLDRKFLITTPLIMYSEAGDLMLDWLRHVSLSLTDLNIKYVCGDWLTILQMIESGVGYAIIPDSIESNLNDVIHIELPCSVVDSQTYYYLYNKSLAKVPAYRNVLNSLVAI